MARATRRRRGDAYEARARRGAGRAGAGTRASIESRSCSRCRQTDQDAARRRARTREPAAARALAVRRSTSRRAALDAAVGAAGVAARRGRDDRGVRGGDALRSSTDTHLQHRGGRPLGRLDLAARGPAGREGRRRARTRSRCEWSAFLDGQAARARTPEERAVFDSHRLSAYLELGEPERAVPMLQQSERDLPDDYNPPARLATAYRRMKRWDDALAASDRAMALAYGPRKLLLYTTRADIYTGRGDTARRAPHARGRDRVREALPEEQRSPQARVASLQKKLRRASQRQQAAPRVPAAALGYPTSNVMSASTARGRQLLAPAQALAARSRTARRCTRAPSCSTSCDGGRGGAAGREQVVDDHHALPPGWSASACSSSVSSPYSSE